VIDDVELVGMFEELDEPLEEEEDIAKLDEDDVVKLEDEVSGAVTFGNPGTVPLYVPFPGDRLGQYPL